MRPPKRSTRGIPPQLWEHRRPIREDGTARVIPGMNFEGQTGVRKKRREGDSRMSE